MVHTATKESAFTFAGGRVQEDTYAPSQWQRKHAHAHTNVSLVLAGSLEEKACGRVEQAFPLSVVVKPVDTDHDDRFGANGARMFSIILTPEFTHSLRHAAPDLNHWRWDHGGFGTRSMLSLLLSYRRRLELPEGDFENCIYETLASLPYIESRDCISPPRWVELIRQELHDTLSDSVRVRDLAARAQVHPVYLARRFRQYVGSSITDYRARLRLRAAAEILSSSNSSIAAAASQCGFADQSHLCRAFKTATGLTPLQYRRLIS